MSTSTLRIKLANFFAKRSCPAWQSNKAIRKACRKIYRFLMETGAKSYPYENMDFAPWEESEGDFYTIITDSNNNVIRRSTSYVAWMIKRHCGSWPKRPVPGERKPGEHAFDARHWDEILDYNGWDRVPMELWSLQPKHWDSNLNAHVCLVGIIPDEGEFGQLVWFIDEDQNSRTWRVATFKDFRKVEYSILESGKTGVVWYKKNY